MPGTRLIPHWNLSQRQRLPCLFSSCYHNIEVQALLCDGVAALSDFIDSPDHSAWTTDRLTYKDKKTDKPELSDFITFTVVQVQVSTSCDFN